MPLDDCPLCIASLFRLDDGVPLRHNFADAIFPHLRMGKDFNSDLTENSVAKAKSPSDFQNFPKLIFRGKNCGLPQFFQLLKINFVKSHMLYSINQWAQD